MLKDEALTYKIRGCVFEVYRHLGAGPGLIAELVKELTGHEIR